MPQVVYMDIPHVTRVGRLIHDVSAEQEIHLTAGCSAVQGRRKGSRHEFAILPTYEIFHDEIGKYTTRKGTCMSLGVDSDLQICEKEVKDVCSQTRYRDCLGEKCLTVPCELLTDIAKTRQN